VFLPSRCTAAVLVAFGLLPCTLFGAEPAPAGKPGGSQQGNNQPAAAPAKHHHPGGDDVEELEGSRARALGNLEQLFSWLASTVPIVLCIVGFLTVVIIIRSYARRIAEETAYLDMTVARPRDREKPD